ELADYDATLAKEFANDGRKTVNQLHGWREALAAVEGRARVEAEEAARGAAVEDGVSAVGEVAGGVASGANVAGDPGGLGDTAAAGDWLTERYGGEDAYGAAFGGGAHGAAAQATSGAFAAGQAGHAGHAHAAQGAHASGAPAGVEPALEAALLDDRVAI